MGVTDVAIKRSVGIGAVNNGADVKVIKRLLLKVPASEGGPTPDITRSINPEAGWLDPRSQLAIMRFQRRQFDCGNGRIEPDGITLGRLIKLAGAGDPPFGYGDLSVTKGLLQAYRRLFANEAFQVPQHVAPPPALSDDDAGLVRRIITDMLPRSSVSLEDCKNNMRPGTPPIHWCGLFAAWVLRETFRKLGGGVQITWRQGEGSNILANGAPLPTYEGPMALKTVIGAQMVDFIDVGDICVLSGEAIHHVIVYQKGAPTFQTVEGNAPGIQHSQRDVNLVRYFYSPFSLMSM